MKTYILIFSFVILSMAGSTWAVGPGKILEFSNNPQGTVTMDGTTHGNAGLACAACHNKELFPDMKLGAVKITMKDIQAEKLCGKCHDGKSAFAVKDNCSRCHYVAGA